MWSAVGALSSAAAPRFFLLSCSCSSFCFSSEKLATPKPGLADKYDINYIIARCFSFIGPGLPLNMHYAVGNFIRDALTKKYEGQAELLAKQKEDLGYGMADFAQGLLKFAAADPTKATTQQLAEAFSDMPEKAKEATIQKRAIELAESGLEADQAIVHRS